MAWIISEKDAERLLGIQIKKTKVNKYHSQKTVAHGKEFDSSLEARRYSELLLLERAGEIKDLQTQVPFELIPGAREPDKIGKRGGVKKGKVIERPTVYIADFVYYDKNGNKIVEDTKGHKTKDYKIKRKLMLYIHGIKIKEITK